MNARRQLLAVVILVVLLLPLGLVGLGGSAGIGPLELAVWLAVELALVVAFFTWGRGPRDQHDEQDMAVQDHATEEQG